MTTTIGKIFELTVKRFPNKDALYDVRKNVRYTYKEWNEQANRLAHALVSEGVKKGDRVSTFMFNTEELGTAFFACAKIGAIFNPINFRLTPEEVAYILADATPKVVLFEKSLEPVVSAVANRFDQVAFWFIDEEKPEYASSYQEKLSSASTEELQVEVNENDIYAFIYTSGTTGRPKGVMHTHRNMVDQSLLCIAAQKVEAEDVGLVTAPMFHCAELHCAFLPRVQIGAKNVILHQFNPKAILSLIEKEKISRFFAAPTMWNMLLQEDLSQYDLSSLKQGLYGAAPMAPSLVHALHDSLGISLIQAYGMTEMGPAITFLSAYDQLRKAGSAGQAALNHDIRIVRTREDGPSEPDDLMPTGETGEIIVKGPCMMIGYFNREEATENALYKGWYHSGDIGYLDEDGFLFVNDRVDDMIISGGENIYPREVEDVLHAHPGVLDVAIVGQPDDRWGETVSAFVVKKDPTVTEQELDEFCKNSDSLANYKRPRKYVFCEALPRNASGKIQKFVLRKQLEELFTPKSS
ncbi:fatty acid--CoA ligase [Neobacillus sp. MM2021_6]|uniref:fatty acid--CoA ligase n=1 Tax=Bacillaceae TaxID=186817 RepID=UPI001409EAC4|nr:MULTISPECIES: fatty acid--CoA ligase [Bacillaceae]MBO0959821.1 fatty acid--CoA ligase [Neobacillus sp. MM2021_6]NHC20123.1 fatty acid--CoA ligase [Bacillus sp. MM2020_4]